MSLSKQILELAEKYRDYTAENLSKMVRIKSLSLQEKAVALEIKRQMEEAGFDEAFIDGLGNVIGRVGNGKRIVAIDGHIDTVDLGNPQNWEKDPLSGDIRDGFVHGRGTVDQKGGVAAFVTAGRILKELNYEGDYTVYFTGTVIEEDCDGLCWKYIVEEDGIRPEWVISTEPTHLGIYRGHRGRMEIELEVRGVSCHGSAPHRGDNAIYKASKICLEIEKLNENLASDPFLGKGTVAVTEFVSKSPSLCAVSDYAKIHLDRRLTWGETKDSALAEVDAIAKRFCDEKEYDLRVLQYEETAYTGIRYGMEKYYPTWKIPEDHPLIVNAVKNYRELFQETPNVDKWTFSTNGIMTNGVYDIPTVGFGPGNEALAHAPNERIPIDDLVKASAFYAGMVMGDD